MAAITVLQKLSPKSLFTISAPVTYYHLNSVKNAKISKIPIKVNWNKNWDHRESKEQVKKVKAVRHLFLVRHGNYHVKEDSDSKKCLTELGKQQACLTGERLALLDIKWDLLVKSTLIRAQETASIISTYLPAGFEVKDCHLIAEGFPALTEYKASKDEHRVLKDNERIEAGFRKYFHRAPPEQTKDSYTLLVAHSNVIRYFVCRVLQFPGEGWMRFVLSHGSITSISIKPTGFVRVHTLGDVGFMHPQLLTHK